MCSKFDAVLKTLLFIPALIIVVILALFGRKDYSDYDGYDIPTKGR